MFLSGLFTPALLFFIFPYHSLFFWLYILWAVGILIIWLLVFHREYVAIKSFVQEMSKGNYETTLDYKKLAIFGHLGEILTETQHVTVQRLGDTRRRRKEIEAILTSMGEGVVATDQSGKVILFNPAASEIFSFAPPKVIGQKAPDVFPYDFNALIEEVLASGEARNAEITMEQKGERLLMVHASPIKRGESDVLGVVAVMEDVTELRRLERVRTEFVANVSHELKTPLTSIKGFVETLVDEAEDPQLRKRFLNIINREANRLSTLIEDLLELSRLEAKDTRLELEPVNISRVARHVLAVLEPRLMDKKLQIVNKLPDELLVLGVRELLQEVFVNFLDNAIKYTPEGGKITIYYNFVDEHIMRLYIADTGVGIPPESLHRLYERFYRVDKARSREIGGTGLGLSIVKHIIEKHGGEVSVESEEGKGSIFSFSLQRGDKL